MSVRILEGDALTVLRTLPDQSVQCCVTSPPYFGLRDYGVVGQLGLEKTPQLYVDAMVGVFSEVKRVLRDDGTLWLNIGDSYAGSGKGGNPEEGKQATNRGSQSIGVLYGKTGETARQAAVTNVTRKTFDGIKAKDLIGIPWMLAFALRADGWYLRSDIIWHKPNPMPESVTDRPTKSHEYLFLLTKSERYFYDADAIAEPSAETSILRLAQPTLEDQQGSSRVPGKTNGPMKAVGGSTRNARSVWSITTVGYSEAHFATFPPKLIEPCILAGSAKQACEKCDAPWERISGREKQPEAYADQKYDTANPLYATKRNMGARYQAELNANPKLTLGFKPTCDCENSGTASSLILDPFGGAGTTGLVADRLGRDALLVELNPNYAEMARKRIHSDNPLFTDVA